MSLFYYWIPDPEREGYKLGLEVDDSNFNDALNSGLLRTRRGN